MDFQLLPIDSLSPNPLRPRGTIPRKSLLELADSIRKYGILVPLLVGKTPVGRQIIAGERRWRAAKIAGLREVPTIIIEVDQKEMALLALTENMQREPLNLLEQAATIKRLREEFNLDLQEIGERMGLPVEELKMRLRLLEVPDKVKKVYTDGKLSDKELFELCKIKDPMEMVMRISNL